ncbi:MAG TPA: hypothetical protein VFK24_10670 [Gammaproteobacteria bacterium]|nr:hypothetical protein [Gammaproteobacteria bacterium]
MKLLIAGLMLAAVAASGIACAKDKPPAPNTLGYSYLRASYVSQQSDYFGDGARGYAIEGAWLIDGHTYLLGSATRLDFNRLPGNERVYGVGVGYQENPMGDISAFLQAQFFRASAETAPSAFGDHVDGYAKFSWGFRTLLGKTSPWEADAAVYYDSHTNFGSRHFGVWLGVGAVWNHFGVRLLGDHNSVQDTVRLSLSWYF